MRFAEGLGNIITLDAQPRSVKLYRFEAETLWVAIRDAVGMQDGST